MNPLAKNYPLGSGWVLDCEPGNASGEFFWTVISPDQRHTASLDFALEVGTTSDDEEKPIPASVLKAAEKLANKLSDAGLY